MTSEPSSVGDRNVQRWGGLAAVLGGIVFLIVFVIVIVFVGVDSAEADGWIVRFPEIRAARTAENGLYLAVIILWVTSFLALYRTLRQSDLAASLFGSVLGIFGLAVLAVSALPHVATAPISDLYHASGTSPEDQAALVLIWQATQGIFDALLAVGLLIVPIGIVLLGMAMLRSPAFGRGLARFSIVLGLVGALTAAFDIVAGTSQIAAIGVLGLIVFHLVVGWRLYRLSRLAHDSI